MISERDQIILRDLSRSATASGATCYVIGAGARLLVYDWPHDVRGGRGTTDWDIAVRVPSWKEYERLRDELVGPDAPFREADEEHRLVHDSGRYLDLVPFGGVEADNRTITYPKGETTHSVLGLAECETCCIAVDIGDGISVLAVEAPGLALLKAVSYLDRRSETTRDIRDLDFIVRTYRDVLGDEKVYGQAADVLLDEAVDYEDVGAYILGRETLELRFPAATLQPLHKLTEELVVPTSPAVDDLVAGRMVGVSSDRDAVVQRYAAMRLGLEA